MAKYTFLKSSKSKDYEKNNYVPCNCIVTWHQLIKSATCWGTPGAYLRKDNSYKNWSKWITFTFFKRKQTPCWDKHRDFWKVKSTWNDDQLQLPDTENLAYVSIHNFDRMHWMEKFYAYPTERTENNKSWKF